MTWVSSVGIKNNPSGKIIAINLDQPSYLGNEDFILKDDCQKIIPELKKICGKEIRFDKLKLNGVFRKAKYEIR